MRRRELERGGQRIPDLAAEALRQRLRNRNALAITAERVRVEVVRVGVLGRLRTPLRGPARRLFEQRELRLGRLFEVVGVNRLRLDRRVRAGAACSDTCFDRLLELAGVIVAPRVEDGYILGERLAVAAVQPVPLALERRAVVGIRLVGMGKFRPLLRHANSPG